MLSNRLYSVDDAVTNASLSATDMEDMPAYINASPNTSNNYTYTQIGELKSDAQEEIQEIVWRVDSKISEITRTSGSAKKNLKFEYDAMGNRVAKHVYAGSVLESSTYYVRDAQGNVMGVYEHKMDAENAVMEYRLIERNIYGSAQVGICKDTVDLNITNSSGALTQATYYHARQLNHRQYSLSNHLGNVLTTLGDGKAPVDSNSDGVIDYYVAYIISVSDYSPFGVELANRSWSIEEYRNGFQKQEQEDEVAGVGNHYTAPFWEYCPRTARRWNLDPVDQISISNYAVLRLNPIFWSDPLGSKVEPTTEKAKSEMNKYGEKTILNKKGKEIANKNYEPAFGEIYQKWKNDDNIHVKFTTIGDEKSFGGSIEYEGKNEAGQKVYNVMWNPNLTEQLGASGIFEESFHLMEALEGKEMAFPETPNSGVMGLDIYDEVRAKQWVGNNINSMKSTFILDGDYYGYTHYGYIKKLNDTEVIKKNLMEGTGLLSPIKKSDPHSGDSFGGVRPVSYSPLGFGGLYNTFPAYNKKP